MNFGVTPMSRIKTIICTLFGGVALFAAENVMAQDEPISVGPEIDPVQVAKDAFKYGMQAYEYEKYEFARAYFNKACKGGQPGGCFNLGLMLENGVGGPEQLQTARILYKAACDGDMGEGCYYLANMETKGTGGPMDTMAARAHYGEACGLGGIKSCTRYADMLAKGEGGSIDLEQAAVYYDKACKKNYKVACKALYELDY